MSDTHDHHYINNDEYKKIVEGLNAKVSQQEKLIKSQQDKLNNSRETELLKIIREKNDEIDKLQMKLLRENSDNMTAQDWERYSKEMSEYGEICMRNPDTELTGTIKQSKM